jgi:glycine/D-amino acid oxidase-like deaminating enzyme
MCSRSAVRDFSVLLRSAGHDALRRLPSVYYAANRRHLEPLREEHRLRTQARLAGRWLDPPALEAVAGIDAPGAILTAGNAETDPYRACLAVARAARDAGAAMHERTAVRRIRRDGDAALVELEHGGVIRAGWAVIATGYATPAFKRLAGRFRMMNTYVVATPRLTARQRRQLGLGDVMLWDTGRPYHYVRWTPDGRLLIGGRDRPQRREAHRHAALRRRAGELIDDLVTLYPSLRGIRAEYAWEGLFATTPDGLPYIGSHRQHPRQLFALGYGGNGMTLGFFGAQAVVRHVFGRPGPDDELFGFRRPR